MCVCVCVCQEHVCLAFKVLRHALLVLQSVMLLHNLTDGQFVKKFPLDVGSISSVSGKHNQTEMFFGFVSFLTPGIFYRCDMTSDDLVPTVLTLAWSMIGGACITLDFSLQ